MMSRRQVYVFCKYPEPGRVKTRLAAMIGDAPAAEIARILLLLTIERLTPLANEGIELVLFADPRERVSEFAAWVSDAWTIVPQPPGDLGTRLEYAFDAAPCDTVVVGSDCPDIDAQTLVDAFDQVCDKRLIFGPTPDGGFYLMAARHIPSEYFQNVSWSSSVTLQQLRERAEQSGFEIALGPELYDVDTEADLGRWRENAQDKERSDGVTNSDHQVQDSTPH
jgi:rSAM/selenodomain-associated transferase 1